MLPFADENANLGAQKKQRWPADQRPPSPEREPAARVITSWLIITNKS